MGKSPSYPSPRSLQDDDDDAAAADDDDDDEDDEDDKDPDCSTCPRQFPGRRSRPNGRSGCEGRCAYLF